MRWLTQLAIRTKMLFGRGVHSARLDDELRFHLERQVAENIAAGMSAEEARYAALRAFGNPALTREQTRTTWSWSWIESVSSDLRYGVRMLWHSPGFTLIAVLVMALASAPMSRSSPWCAACCSSRCRMPIPTVSPRSASG